MVTDEVKYVGRRKDSLVSGDCLNFSVCYMAECALPTYYCVLVTKLSTWRR